MNDQTPALAQAQPEIVDLGDARQVTMGPPWDLRTEENPLLMQRK